METRGENNMVKLEDLKENSQVNGILSNQTVTIITLKWRGDNAVEIFYKKPDGSVDNRLFYRSDEDNLSIVKSTNKWDFSADPEAFKLAAEAYRIHLAHLFDPVLAVHTSLIEPLPHQIIAVYEQMLPRQPLRFLLADDPGAGKTIMAGLLIKELIIRGDVERSLICVPGNLAAQWQDELWFKFQLRYEIITRESFETSVVGNPFQGHDHVIIRLDQIARNEDYKEKLAAVDWDIVVVDEAHKMSAHFWSGDLEETKRFKLGKLLRAHTRHLLLMTATPHSGIEEDFQLFLSLLDQDRFEGRFREGVHDVEISDLMRRMVKEELRRFDGRPLFPERKAFTIDYPLPADEAKLYELVTAYVREEFNRAEALVDGRRKGSVGFALTILQRRLASSPSAIYHSLRRRREKLEKRLADFENQIIYHFDYYNRDLEDDDEYLYDEDLPAEEMEEFEEEVVDSATASLTIEELQAEIVTLKDLEGRAFQLLRSGHDRKWDELSKILQDDQHMVSREGERRKLVIFTEHRDTLNYLKDRIKTLFGREDMVVHIDGGVPRDKRRRIENEFRNNPDVYFLLGTDAAGEGINLQQAHLMVNYDLPWNPNRLEQRFGRIHRIGQTEVCYMWNLVAGETREGYVYKRLLTKLETENQALNGKVFDVLGEALQRESLSRLLIEAVRHGDSPEVRARLDEAIDNSLDQERVRDLLEAKSLAQDHLDITKIMSIRKDMERYNARKLQPHYIKAFFMQAFQKYNGTIAERQRERFRIDYVPAKIRNRSKTLQNPLQVLKKYDRITFSKSLIESPGYPLADFICPGHPLLDTLIHLTLDDLGNILQSGSILVNESDPCEDVRLLFFLEHSIYDEVEGASSQGHLLSKEVHFVQADEDDNLTMGGSAPYLNYRSPLPKEQALINQILSKINFNSEQMADQVINYAIENLVPKHMDRIRRRREEQIRKTKAAVHERLTKEINYWDRRAAELRKDVERGKANAKVNLIRTEQRADDLHERLEGRKAQLDKAQKITTRPPVIVGGTIVVPLGLLQNEVTGPDLAQRRIIENIAMQAVMESEAEQGNHPEDVSQHNLGYDIESLDPETNKLRFLEVKGRQSGADTITVSKNEILTGLNSGQQYYLVIVPVENGHPKKPIYIQEPFKQEPEFAVTSINYNWNDLISQKD